MVTARLIEKADVEKTAHKELDVRQPYSTWLCYCAYEVQSSDAGNVSNRYIVVMHVGIRGWKVSPGYRNLEVGRVYRLRLGAYDAYRQYQMLPCTAWALSEEAWGYPLWFDMNEVPGVWPQLKKDQAELKKQAREPSVKR